MEETLVLIKPDAVNKEVWLDIIEIYQESGLKITKTRLFIKMGLELLTNLYKEHHGKDFCADHIAHMHYGPVIALCVQGENAIERVRKINGNTYPDKAEKGTIREMFGTNTPANAVHASDSTESAKRELKLIFEKSKNA